MSPVVSLGELIEPAAPKRAGQKTYPILSMTMHDGLVDQDRKFKKRIASANTSTYKVVARNQLVVGFPIDEGVLSFQDLYDEAIVSPAYDVWNLIDPDRTYSSYLERYLRSPAALVYYSSRLRGTTARRRSLPSEMFVELPVPLPTPEEQRRIVEVLDRADALRAMRHGAIARLDELAQSIFLDMFGDIVANDRNWPMARVDSIVSRFEGGRSLLSPQDDGDASQLRILKISAVTSGEFLAVENKPAPPGYTPKAEHFARPGDLLFSRANTSELVGATAIVDECPPNLLLPDKLWRFVWRRPVVVHPLYVRQVFHQPRFRELVSSVATGSSGSMKNISQAKLLALPFVLPSYALQEKFAQSVTSISSLRLTQRAHLAAANALFASLEYRAFRGEL